MPKTWAEVAGSDEFQKLGTPEKEQARQQYFDQVVAPQVPQEQRDAALTQFKSDTQKSLEKPVSQVLGFEKGILKVWDNAATGLKAIADPWNLVDTLGSIAGLPSAEEAKKGHEKAIESKPEKPGKIGEFGGEVAAGLPFMPLSGGSPWLAGGIMGGLTTDKTSPGGIATDVGLGAVGGKVADVGLTALGRAVKKPVQTATRAATDYVAGLASKAGKTATDIADYAKQTFWKPVTGAEAIGRSGKTTLKAIAAREGATSEILEPKLAARQRGTARRVLQDFSDTLDINPEAAQGNIESLVDAGKKAAEPLYKRANAGGSIAPLRTQLEKEFSEAGKRESEAQTAVDDAQRDILLARAQAQRAGPTATARAAREAGAPNSVGEAEKAATDKLNQALSDLQVAQADKEEVLTTLRQAQEDLASGKKGGIWNPRIQRILSDPITKAGMRKGLEEQRLEAVSKYQPFDPKEYAVTGFDQAGDPIVSRVPNMRLLDATKKGLDTIINEAKDPITKQIQWTPRLYHIDQIRRNLVSELREANKDYGIALDTSGDYLSAQSAYNMGQKAIFEDRLTEQKFAERFNDMTNAERDAFKGGLANRLFNMAQTGKLKPGALKDLREQEKLWIVFGKQKTEQLVKRLEVESEMAKSGARMHPGVGSETYGLEAAEEDSGVNYRALSWGVRALSYLKNGDYLKALSSTVASLGESGWAFAKTPGMPGEVRDQVGKLLMMSPEELATALKDSPVGDDPQAIKSILQLIEAAKSVTVPAAGVATSGLAETTHPQQ